MPQLTLPFLTFSAIVVAIYWVIPGRWRTLFLSISSMVFLGYLDPVSLAVLVALSGLVFYYGRHPERSFLYGFCLAIVSLLFCLIRFIQLARRTHFGVPYIVLIGFGFYALKLIHYCVESRTGSFRSHNFLDFYGYMLFFPTITIGPIHRFEDFLKSERRIRWDDANFASGLERILYGYVKVIVLANWLVAIQFDAFASRLQPNGSLAVLADSMVYGFYLYFAFAGYSDIAIGLSLLFGYTICENFHYPFLKRNIGEFWQSWHMSLSGWCRQYVFLPLYAKTRNLAIGLIGAMLAIALWHEFSLRFLFWGIFHGSGLLIWRWYQKSIGARMPEIQNKTFKMAGLCLSVILTFLFVMVGFTIPRSESFQEIVQNFRQLLGLNTRI